MTPKYLYNTYGKNIWLIGQSYGEFAVIEIRETDCLVYLNENLSRKTRSFSLPTFNSFSKNYELLSITNFKKFIEHSNINTFDKTMLKRLLVALVKLERDK